MKQTRTIYHFEDEGQRFQFLPEALQAHYWFKYPTWRRPQLTPLADNGTYLCARVDLFPSSAGTVVVDYKLFQTKELFEELCTPRDGDVVLNRRDEATRQQ
jgi:hypothetical protein